jgi:hypothetical protein
MKYGKLPLLYRKSSFAGKPARFPTANEIETLGFPANYCRAAIAERK